jgi:hypothetical protein
MLEFYRAPRVVTMKRRHLILHTLLLFALSFAGAATAQTKDGLGFRGWGIRGGLSIDPDQIFVGAHINAGQFAKRVRFQPSFEIGFGNDLVVGSVNLDALYTFRARGWQPYLGGGLGIALIDADRNGRGDDFNVEAGLNLIAGFEYGTHRLLLLELRVGVGDIPNFKVTAGIGF